MTESTHYYVYDEHRPEEQCLLLHTNSIFYPIQETDFRPPFALIETWVKIDIVKLYGVDVDRNNTTHHIETSFTEDLL